MAFGTWYDDDDNAYIVDGQGRKISWIDALAKVRAVLAEKPKEELLTALIDRLDLNDIIGHITDAEQNFLPGILPQEEPQAGE